MFKTKLKVSQSENLNNVFVKKEQVEVLKSSKGWDYANVVFGDYTIIIDAKFTHVLPNGAISVGIKDNFKYKLKDTDATVLGKDLFKYIKEVNAEIKSLEAEKEDLKETKNKQEKTK